MSLLKRATASNLDLGDVIIRNGERLMVHYIDEEKLGRNIHFKQEFGGDKMLFMTSDDPVTIEL